MAPFFLTTITFSLLLVKKKVVKIFERIPNFCNQFFWLQKYESMKLLKTMHVSLRKYRLIIRSNDNIIDISMITLDLHFFQNETFKGTLGNGIPKNFKKVLCKTSLKRSSIVKKDLVTDTFLRLSLNI